MCGRAPFALRDAAWGLQRGFAGFSLQPVTPMSWIILFSILGIILICLELFLPGMVVGTAGGVCLVLAVALTYVKYGVVAGNMALAALAIASAVGIVIWLFVFPRTRSGRSMITSRDLADSKSAEPLDALLNQEGEALTQLRPAGTVRIAGRRVDAVAESGLIAPMALIRVVRVEGNRVFVRKLDDQPLSSPSPQALLL